ncbi:unnamed protein product [Symbiodinium microadriaticum]|nr:unnamed protein product [Symbiodinium microadriaticum]
MGCVETRFASVYSKYPIVRSNHVDYETLLLSESDVGQLYNIYLKLSPPERVEVTASDICDHLHIDDTPFARKVLGLGEGMDVSFATFVIGVWNFCTIDKNCFELFVHDLYDTSRKGVLSIADIDVMIKEVYGNDYHSNIQAKRACLKLQEVQLVEMDVYSFRQFSKAHNAVFYPIFSMQSRVRCCVLGDAFWCSKALCRIHMSKREYVPIHVILSRRTSSTSSAGIFTDNCSSSIDDGIDRKPLAFLLRPSSVAPDSAM